MKKFFGTMAVMVVFAIGFAASDDSDSSETSFEPTPQTEENAPQTETDEAPQKTVSHDFFENGYTYSAVYTVSRAVGYGGSDVTHYYNLKIYNDGTKEVTFSWDPGTGNGRCQEMTENFKLRKKSDSYRDVQATWYEIEWSYGHTMGGRYQTSAVRLYVDEKGNIIELGVNGNTKNIYEAISTGDCIYGKFTKQPL